MSEDTPAVRAVRRTACTYETASSTDSLLPVGPWRYPEPVAVLGNSGTGSAAELLLCYLRAAADVTIVGSPSAGYLSGAALYVGLPCGLAARISPAYLCLADGTPVEGRGVQPDVEASETLDDVLAGRDTVLDRAVEVLLARSCPRATSYGGGAPTAR